MKNIQSKKGFTLIELMVVILIIAILGAIGIVSYGQANRTAKNARRASDMEAVRQALILFRQEQATNCFPASITVYGDLGDPGPLDPYISTLPADPVDNAPLVYSYSRLAGTVGCPTSIRLTYRTEQAGGATAVVNIDIP